MRNFILATALVAIAAAIVVRPAAAVHGRGEGPHTSQPSSTPRVTQRDLRSERLGPKSILQRPTPSPVQVIRVVRTDSFDWADAAVGAGSAAAVVALATGVTLLLARRRKVQAESALNPASI